MSTCTGTCQLSAASERSKIALRLHTPNARLLRRPECLVGLPVALPLLFHSLEWVCRRRLLAIRRLRLGVWGTHSTRHGARLLGRRRGGSPCSDGDVPRPPKDVRRQLARRMLQAESNAGCDDSGAGGQSRSEEHVPRSHAQRARRVPADKLLSAHETCSLHHGRRPQTTNSGAPTSSVFVDALRVCPLPRRHGHSRSHKTMHVS